jgi:hypothetical protein
MLDYEEALTREFTIPSSTASSIRSAKYDSGEVEMKYYNTSAHFLWIGDRTRSVDGAHVEYFRGIRNPIGIKVGPTMRDDEIVRLLDSAFFLFVLSVLLSNPWMIVVNPDKEVGKVTLITRYGATKVSEDYRLCLLNIDLGVIRLKIILGGISKLFRRLDIQLLGYVIRCMGSELFFSFLCLSFLLVEDKRMADGSPKSVWVSPSHLIAQFSQNGRLTF